MPWLFTDAVGEVIWCKLAGKQQRAWLDELLCGKHHQPLQKEMHQGPWLEGNYCSDCDDFDFPLQLVSEGPLTHNSYFCMVTLG